MTTARQPCARWNFRFQANGFTPSVPRDALKDEGTSFGERGRGTLGWERT